MKTYITTDIHDVTRIVIKKEQEHLMNECYITKILFITNEAKYEVTAFGTKESVKIEGREA
jgi:hypothetical protein